MDKFVYIFSFVFLFVYSILAVANPEVTASRLEHQPISRPPLQHHPVQPYHPGEYHPAARAEARQDANALNNAGNAGVQEVPVNTTVPNGVAPGNATNSGNSVNIYNAPKNM